MNYTTVIPACKNSIFPSVFSDILPVRLFADFHECNYRIFLVIFLTYIVIPCSHIGQFYKKRRGSPLRCSFLSSASGSAPRKSADSR